MEKPRIVYNLNRKAAEFIEEAERKGFYFKKLSCEEESIRNYEVIKKITPAEDQLRNFEIIGHLLRGQILIIHSLQFPIKTEGLSRRRAIKQLEKLTKDFVAK